MTKSFKLRNNLFNSSIKKTFLIRKKEKKQFTFIKIYETLVLMFQLDPIRKCLKILINEIYIMRLQEPT